MEPKQVRFEAIGTKWQLLISQTVSEDSWQELLSIIEQRIEVFDKSYSRFRDDSLVSLIARQAGRHALPPDGYELLSFYQRLYTATGGKVTPLIGQTMVEAGYDATYSLRPGKMHRPPKWEDVLRFDRHSLIVERPVLLDFGAAGKGYLVDIIARLVEAAGIDSYVIDASGDIRHRSADGDKLAVGLENPLDVTEVVGVIELANRSLCASAGSKRQWQGMHHIIDPDSLRSPREILATWVVAEDTMTADGLATALFFCQPEQLRDQFEFSYATLDADMGLAHSETLPLKTFGTVSR